MRSRLILMKKSPPPQGNLFAPPGFVGSKNMATKEGTLAGMQATASPEEHITNAVMHLSRTGEATVGNIAARAGLSHVHAIGLLSKLRLAGHVIRDGPQYRLGAPLPEGGIAAKPKKSGTTAPARQLQPDAVEEAVRALGFQ